MTGSKSTLQPCSHLRTIRRKNVDLRSFWICFFQELYLGVIWCDAVLTWSKPVISCNLQVGNVPWMHYFWTKCNIVSGQPLFAWFCMAWQGRFEIKMCSWPDLRSRRSVKQACMYMKFNVSKHPCFRLNATKIWPKTWPMLLAKLWACKKIGSLPKQGWIHEEGCHCSARTQFGCSVSRGWRLITNKIWNTKKHPQNWWNCRKNVSKTCFINNLVCRCLWKLWFEILQNRPAN